MTKAPTTTRRAASRPALPEPAEEEAVPDFSTSKEEPVEEERRPLFSVDGEIFTVPKVIDERVTFLAMNYTRTEGSLFGAMYLMELVLGASQYARLIGLYEEKKIEPKKWDEMTGLVSGLLFKKINGDDGQAAAGKASDSSPTS